MSIPSRRDIQTRLFTVVGAAALSLVASGVYAEMKIRKLDRSQATVHVATAGPELSINQWDDVNLATGRTSSPEDDLAMARSGILGDFEAR